jgi:hypothetical protein
MVGSFRQFDAGDSGRSGLFVFCTIKFGNMIRITISESKESYLERIVKVLNKVCDSHPFGQPQKKTGIEEALEDVENGRVHEFESVDELFAHLGV